MKFRAIFSAPLALAARKDDTSALVHEAMAKLAELSLISGGGGLIQTTSG